MKPGFLDSTLGSATLNILLTHSLLQLPYCEKQSPEEYLPLMFVMKIVWHKNKWQMPTTVLGTQYMLKKNLAKMEMKESRNEGQRKKFKK